MNDTNKKFTAEILDAESLSTLSSAPIENDIATDQYLKMRDRLLNTIEQHENPATNFITITQQGGQWHKLSSKIYKKVLNVDQQTQVESYLLRLEPGARIPEHNHDHDELCMVLEGQVSFTDIQLNKGDYHYAPKGSHHGTGYSEKGAILFLQSKVDEKALSTTMQK